MQLAQDTVGPPNPNLLGPHITHRAHTPRPQASGAYIFRTNASGGLLYPVGGASVTVTTATGPLVSEARLVFSTWASVVFRLWRGANTIDVEYTIGGIPIDDRWGKEIITRWSAPSIASQATWYSDSNGRDSNTRVRDFRPYWKYNATYEPVAVSN